jgi:glucose/arabinose dehydrogenase
VNRSCRSLTSALCAAVGIVGAAQERPKPPPPPAVPLTAVPVEKPVVLTTEAGVRVRVVPVARGLSHPSGLVFLPDSRTMLLTERPGRLRIVKDGVLDPNPILELPKLNNVSLGGLQDLVLHPDFATNHVLYLSYSKEGDRGVTLAVARARLDGTRLADVKDEINVLVAGHNYGWPLVSTGRNYTGTPVSDQPWFRPGMEMPVFQWNPVINPANMIFYTGRKFAKWTNSPIVAGAGSKKVVQMTLTRGMVVSGDSMLHELNVRFRDVRQGPDELLYLLTEGRSRGNNDTDGMLLRLEPE